MVANSKGLVLPVLLILSLMYLVIVPDPDLLVADHTPLTMTTAVDLLEGTTAHAETEDIVTGAPRGGTTMRIVEDTGALHLALEDLRRIIRLAAVEPMKSRTEEITHLRLIHT